MADSEAFQAVQLRLVICAWPPDIIPVMTLRGRRSVSLCWWRRAGREVLRGAANVNQPGAHRALPFDVAAAQVDELVGKRCGLCLAHVACVG